LMLSACVFPVSQVDAPKVTGILVENGHPVANAEIILTHWFPNPGERLTPPVNVNKAVTRTRSDGTFTVGPLSSIQIVHLLGDPIYFYTLIIVRSGERVLGSTVSGIGGASAAEDVTCDLAKPIFNGEVVVHCDHN